MDEANVIGEIASNNSGVIGTIHVTVNQPKTVRKVIKNVVEKYADGTIGRDANRRNYIRYLMDRYYECVKADLSFGADPVEHAEKLSKCHVRAYGWIIKDFGAKPYCLPVEKFAGVVALLGKKIDGTILGKNNRRKGTPNFKTFEEFCALGAD